MLSKVKQRTNHFFKPNFSLFLTPPFFFFDGNLTTKREKKIWEIAKITKKKRKFQELYCDFFSSPVCLPPFVLFFFFIFAVRDFFFG